jgi:hypothetical protein
MGLLVTHARWRIKGRIVMRVEVRLYARLMTSVVVCERKGMGDTREIEKKDGKV